MKTLSRVSDKTPNNLPTFIKAFNAVTEAGFHGKFSQTDMIVTETGWWIFKSHNVSYLFQNDRNDPLTYISKNGEWIRPNNCFRQDNGSIPPCAGVLVDKFRFIGFFFHDSGYGEAGLWFFNKVKKTWEFRFLPRKQIDDYLSEMVTVDPVPASQSEKFLVHRFVMVWAWIPWNRHKDGRPKSSPYYLFDRERKK